MRGDYILVIPARLDSTRLSQKLLIEIEGKSIIERTYNQALKALKIIAKNLGQKLLLLQKVVLLALTESQRFQKKFLLANILIYKVMNQYSQVIN